MAIPTWFNAEFYMASKLAQVKAADPDGNWDAAKLKAAFEANGFTGEEGAYAHYDQFSLTEGTNANQYLNQGVYLTAKLAQMQKTDATYTMDKLVAAFKEAGLTVGEHYEQFGLKEGINPSNDFDNAKYMADKLAQLQKDDPKGEWDADKVQAAFANEGLSPLDHYLLYGKAEGLTIKAVDDPIRPVTPGKSFELTKDTDTITGTTGDDTVTGDWTANFSSKDKLTDTTVDNDLIDVTASAAVAADKGQVSGFENLKVTWDNVTAATVDVKNFSGLETLKVAGDKTGYAGDVVVNNAGAVVVTNEVTPSGTLTVNGVTTGTINAGNAKVVSADAYGESGATDTVNLTVGAKATTVTTGANKGFVTTTINAADALKDATISVSGTSGDADSAVITLGKDATVAVSKFGAKEVVTLNTAADTTVTLTSTTAAENFAVNAAGDVTLKVAAANINKDIVTKSGEGSLKVQLTDAAAADLSQVAADSFQLANGGAAYTMGTTANVSLVKDVDLAVSSFTVAKNSNADVLNLTVANNQTGTITTTNYDTVNITAVKAVETGATMADLALGTLVATDANGVGVVNITAASDNNVSFTGLTAGVVNASADKGNLTITSWTGGTTYTLLGAEKVNDITLATGATKANITTNDGNDIINLGAVATTFAGTINTGAGDDAVTIGAGASGTTFVAGSSLNIDFGAGNADTLVLNNSKALDFSAASLTLTGLENVKITTATSTDAGVTFSAAQLSGKDYAFQADVAATVVAVTGKTDAANTIDLGKLTNVTGSTAGNLTFDITGGDKADTITASKFGGTITGGAGADQITLGAGVDKVVYTTLTDSLAAAHDTLAGFVSGTDKIVVSSTQSSAIATATTGFVSVATTGTGTLATDLTTALGGETKMIANGGALVTITGGTDAGTYIVLNGAGTAYDAADAVIQLTGTTTVVAGDFITA